MNFLLNLLKKDFLRKSTNSCKKSLELCYNHFRQYNMAWDEFKKIVKEITEDLKIDRMNLDEKTLRIPSIKHFWVAKLYTTKIRILTLEKKKKSRIDELKNGYVSEIGLSKTSMMQNLNSDEQIMKINEEMEELKLIVDYLEDAKFVLGRVTDDLKNRIELEKVERL